jgi:beta-glucosidase
VTFYKSADQLPPFTDYNMKGRTYRFFEGEPLFPFGYGLSYTTFTYRNLKVSGSKVSVDVENTGTMAGEEVVQLYLKSSVRSLQGFRRITLRPKERRTVEFTLPPKPAPSEISIGGLTTHLRLH